MMCHSTAWNGTLLLPAAAATCCPPAPSPLPSRSESEGIGFTHYSNRNAETRSALLVLPVMTKREYTSVISLVDQLEVCILKTCLIVERREGDEPDGTDRRTPQPGNAARRSKTAIADIKVPLNAIGRLMRAGQPANKQQAWPHQSRSKSNSFRISFNTACMAAVSSPVRCTVGRRDTNVCVHVSSGGSWPVALTYTWTMPAQSGLTPSRCMMGASRSAAFSFFLTTDSPMY